MVRFRETAFEAALTAAVKDVVQRQKDLGIDIVSDGEFSKRGFAVYAHERLGGLEPTGRARPSAGNLTRSDSFPEFYASEAAAKDRKPTQSSMQMSCTGPITYKGQKQLTAISQISGQPAMPQAWRKPSCRQFHLRMWSAINKRFYGTEEEFLTAVADALNEEYQRHRRYRFPMQIDDPRLINYYVKNPQLSVGDCRSWAEER